MPMKPASAAVLFAALLLPASIVAEATAAPVSMPSPARVALPADGLIAAVQYRGRYYGYRGRGLYRGPGLRYRSYGYSYGYPGHYRGYGYGYGSPYRGYGFYRGASGFNSGGP